MSINKEKIYTNLIIFFFSLFSFIYFTGGTILFVENTEWLLADDSKYHYLNWLFFQNTPFFQFPIFANPAFGMEFASSLSLNDSIPIMALIFKVFKSLLPLESQYFGLWIFACFLLQMFLAFNLLRKFSTKINLCLIFSIFFLIAPVFLWRLWGHYALLAQWLILLSFILYFDKEFRIIKWVMLIILGFLINPYLSAMLYPIFFADIYNRYKSKEINSIGIYKSVFLLLIFTAISLSLFGYLTIGSSVGTGGYSNYRFNLNRFFDSDTLWSNIMPDLNSIAMDYEGFAFLGVGIIFLLSIVIIDLITTKNIFQRDFKKKLTILFIPCLIMLFFALTNQISFNQHVIFEYEIPLILKPFTKIFRSAGRFSWPMYYFLLLLIFLIVSSSKRSKSYLYILPLLLGLQIYDTSDAANMFRIKMSNPRFYWRNIGGDEKVYKDLLIYWETPLKSNEWKDFNIKYKNFIYVYPQRRTDKAFPIALHAAKNSMSINFGYFSRYSKQKASDSKNKISYELLEGNFNKKSVYIVADDKVWRFLLKQDNSKHLIKELDGYRIFAPDYFN
ncbi:MAG: DUF6311 domain-containing protein [Thermodesulfobacteriota bacterium]|nr:DUF6311 domain-containing protein [Thermodesulfobacteriota bacterium]